MQAGRACGALEAYATALECDPDHRHHQNLPWSSLLGGNMRCGTGQLSAQGIQLLRQGASGSQPARGKPEGPTG